MVVRPPWHQAAQPTCGCHDCKKAPCDAAPTLSPEGWTCMLVLFLLSEISLGKVDSQFIQWCYKYFSQNPFHRFLNMQCNVHFRSLRQHLRYNLLLSDHIFPNFTASPFLKWFLFFSSSWPIASLPWLLTKSFLPQLAVIFLPISVKLHTDLCPAIHFHLSTWTFHWICQKKGMAVGRKYLQNPIWFSFLLKFM